MVVVSKVSERKTIKINTFTAYSTYSEKYKKNRDR